MLINETVSDDKLIKITGAEKERTLAELRLIYPLVQQDIEYVKLQQWRITRYVILCQAGLFGVEQLTRGSFTGNSLILQNIVIVLLGLMACLAGMFLLRWEEGLLRRSRTRMNIILRTFTKEFNELLLYKSMPSSTSNRVSFAITSFQQLIMWVSFIMMVYVLVLGTY